MKKLLNQTTVTEIEVVWFCEAEVVDNVEYLGFSDEQEIIINGKSYTPDALKEQMGAQGYKVLIELLSQDVDNDSWEDNEW